MHRIVKYDYSACVRLLLRLMCLTFLCLQNSYAGPLKSNLAIYIESKDGGDRIQIGELNIIPNANGYKTAVTLDDSKFEDKFLSMRPFNCLPHPQQVVCHLAYPYENKRHITADDLTDLEYDLLFLHKKPEEYGIDAWNGFYYEMKMTDSGFEGELRETDLNILAAPPKDGNLRPIKKSELHEASDKHWPRRVIIE